MKSLSRLILAFLLLVLVGPYSLTAQGSANLTQQMDSLVEAFLQKPQFHGMSIGIGRVGEAPTLFHYGALTQDGAQAPTDASIYTIGSISKTFTALALAKLVETGAVQLTDPVRKFYAPETLGWGEERAISLQDLATHHSGLPRLPTNMKDLYTPQPYANYDEAALKAYLAKCRGKLPEKRTNEYSNLGFGLLGTLLAGQRNQSYEQLIEELILMPYELRHTYVSVPTEESGLVPPHGQFGQPTVHWSFQALAGAGSLFATIGDLVKYGEAVMTDSSVQQLLFTEYEEFGNPDALLGQGLAWIRLPNPNDNSAVWFHNGQTNGGRAFLALVPERQLVFAGLSNASGDIDALCVQLLRLVLLRE